MKNIMWFAEFLDETGTARGCYLWADNLSMAYNNLYEHYPKAHSIVLTQVAEL